MNGIRILVFIAIGLLSPFLTPPECYGQNEISGIHLSKTKGKNLEEKTHFIEQFTRIKVKTKAGEVYKGNFELVGGQNIRIGNSVIHLSQLEWIQPRDFSSIWMLNSSVLLSVGMGAMGGLYYLGNPLNLSLAAAEYHFLLAGIGALLTTGFIVKYKKKKVKNHWQFDAVVISG